jgi:hypothetical protein
LVETGAVAMPTIRVATFNADNLIDPAKAFSLDWDKRKKVLADVAALQGELRREGDKIKALLESALGSSRCRRCRPGVDAYE